MAFIFLSNSAPITANAATAKVVGVGKTFTIKKTTKVSGLSKAEKKIVKVTVNKKKRTVTVKGIKAGKATFKIGKKAYTVKVGATSITKKTVTTSMTAGEKKTLSVNAVNGKGDTIQFTSNKKSVVKVNKASAKATAKKVASTTVTAVAEGTAKITAKSKYTGKSKTFTIKVVAATPAPASQAPATGAPTTGGGVTGTATTAPTATAGTQATATPGTDASATPGTDATKNPDATPGTDATQAPGTDATATPGTDATKNPDTTQAPDVPVAETGTIAVTTNVSGASIKVLSGTSVVAEKTLEGETLTTTFADIKNGTYVVKVSKDGYATVTENVVVAGNDLKVDANLELVKAISAKAKSETKVQINFNGEIDEVAVTNFKVSNATVTSAKLSEDKKSVIVETSTMTKGENYTITTTGLTSNGVAVADAEFTFEAKEVKYELKLSFAGDKTTIASNGKDAVLVTASIYDEDGDLISDLDKVEIQFTTTAGNFAENRVTVQNGKATNMLTSEISTSDISALVTATVVSASNKNILNVTASKTILMTPNVEQAEDQTIGATLTDIAVETADRVVLYFNKDVDVADYTEQDDTTTPKRVYNYAPSKMEVLVQDNANSATTSVTAANRAVIALAPVEGNSKALYAILDVDNGDVLTDNSKVVVKVTDKTKTVETYGEKSTLVSDIRVPSILGVENDGLTTLKVIFSEPVQSTLGGGTDYAANVASHWIIDGTPLTSAKYGSSVAATATVGKFDTATGVDERNVVTIELGKDGNGKQIFFQSGSHSIQGNNIGDWANLTDVKNNIINTQTLDFVIDPDETVPTAEVKVESPEQYTITFNKMVATKDVKDNLTLQKYDTTSAKWVDKYNVVADPATPGIVVTAVDEKNGLAKEFVVEVTKDWTVDLTTSTKFVNYYNNDYRLHINEKKISNPSNGLTNAEIALNLNDDIMKSLDATSPEIKEVTQIGTKNQFTVTMSEPVQVANLGDEVLTPSETQGSAVQKTTVTFISEDGKTTVPGEIVRMTDAHDTAFVVQPTTTTLTAGTWKIVITGLSDDYGNTISTRSDKTFEVKTVTDTVDTTFKVQWIIAVPADNYTVDPIGGNGYNTGNDGDIVYVKFNKKFKTYGGAANAVSTTNYTVNGYAVPTTSKIDASVTGYNDVANEKNNYTDLVAIHLPKDTLTDKSNTVNISSTIEAITGGTVSNYGMKVLDKNGSGTSAYYTYNYKTLSTAAELDTVAEIQKAFANSEYVNVTVPADLSSTEAAKVADTDLTIKSIGTYDLSQVTGTWKSLTIDTEETGTITITGGNYGKIDITAPNADVVIDGVTTTASTGNINVNDVLSGTLTIKGSTTSIGGEVIITDSNAGSAVKIDSLVPAVNVTIATNDVVAFTPNSNTVVTITKAADITFKDAPDSITVDSTAKGLKITSDAGVTLPALTPGDGVTASDLSNSDFITTVTIQNVTGYYSDNNGSDTALAQSAPIYAEGVTTAAQALATLPTTAYAKLEDNTYEAVTLTWDWSAGVTFDNTTDSTYEATATVSGLSDTSKAIALTKDVTVSAARTVDKYCADAQGAALDDVTVDYGTAKADAMAKLPTKVYAKLTDGTTYIEVNVTSWSCESYATTNGTYTATATLPEKVLSGTPGIANDTLTLNIVVNPQ